MLGFLTTQEHVDFVLGVSALFVPGVKYIFRRFTLRLFSPFPFRRRAGPAAGCGLTPDRTDSSHGDAVGGVGSPFRRRVRGLGQGTHGGQCWETKTIQDFAYAPHQSNTAFEPSQHPSQNCELDLGHTNNAIALLNTHAARRTVPLSNALRRR